MPDRGKCINRRAFVALLPGAALSVAGCVTRAAAPPVYLGPTAKQVTYVTNERPGTIWK